MSTIADLIGGQADELARHALSVGDVHLLPLGADEQITAKDGKDRRDKFYVVLGFDKDGNTIGGVVINSRLNANLPTVITDYHYPVSAAQLPFLKHDSFVNCSKLVMVRKGKINSGTFRWHIEDNELLGTIAKTLGECPLVSRQQLKEFSLQTA